MLGGVVMRQTELHLTDEDRSLVDEIRSKGIGRVQVARWRQRYQ
jgi:hypothetical protein